VGNIVPIIAYAIRAYLLSEYHELCGGGAHVLLHLSILRLCKENLRKQLHTRVYNDADIGMSALLYCVSKHDLWPQVRNLLLRAGVSEKVFRAAKRQLEQGTIGEDGYDLVTAAACAYIVARQSQIARRTSFDHTLMEPDKIKNYMEQVNNLREFHNIFAGLTVTNESVFDILERDRDWSKSIIYLDPPYHPEAMTTDDHYGKFSWTVEDHERLVKLLLERPLGKVVLSGLDNRSYKPLVEAGWRQIPLKNMQKSSSGKPGRKQKEEVWINFDIPRELEKWVNEYVPDSE